MGPACRDEVLSNGGVGMEVVDDELGLNLLNLNPTMATVQQSHYSISESIHLQSPNIYEAGKKNEEDD